MDNAVKYTPAGGKVSVSLLARDGRALIVVQDTGIGIDPADRARIFDPFVRLDAARNRDAGGVGLGLALVRSIVAAHGGTVDVESTSGAGSRFTIRLPSPFARLRTFSSALHPPLIPLLRLLAAGRSSLHTRGGRI